MLHKQRTLFSFLSIVKGVATNSEGVWRRASGVEGGGEIVAWRELPPFPYRGSRWLWHKRVTPYCAQGGWGWGTFLSGCWENGRKIGSAFGHASAFNKRNTGRYGNKRFRRYLLFFYYFETVPIGYKTVNEKEFEFRF